MPTPEMHTSPDCGEKEEQPEEAEGHMVSNLLQIQIYDFSVIECCKQVERFVFLFFEYG